jgi:hypothetical protein
MISLPEKHTKDCRRRFCSRANDRQEMDRVFVVGWHYGKHKAIVEVFKWRRLHESHWWG